LKLPIQTLVDIFHRVLDNNLEAAMLSRHHDGSYEKIPSREVGRRVANVAAALNSWSIRKGDRLAVLSENRPQWAIADFASLLLGAVDVPIYPTLTSEQTAYILRDSGAKVVFVSTATQLEKVRSIRNQTALEKIVLMDTSAPGAQDDFVFMDSIMLGSDSTADLRALEQPASPSDLATIIYTSGTTGTPKGVMLTHGNMASNLSCSTETFDWPGKPGYVSFLPLSHVTARHVDYLMMGIGITIAYCPVIDEMAKMLQEIRPHNFVSVPRVYEKIRQEVERHAGTGITKSIFNWAMNVGREHRGDIIAGKRPTNLRWKMADGLVFRHIRGALGGNADCCVSGGAPLALDLAQWYADAGILILEGYGLTETSPVIAVNTARNVKLGTVGQPLPNLQIKIAADGELLVRGPSVTSGYWNLPQETAAAFEDGWFKTGDIAHLDSDGFLIITDRKKDLIKTSGGKFIAPQPIENLLKSNVLVAHAAVIGEQRKYVAVIIAPHFPLLEDWARAHGVEFTTREQLVRHRKVQALFDDIVAELNTRLARFETLKRVLLVPDEFTIASGELTPSLKLKRRVVERKYAAQIDEMYAQPYHPATDALQPQ
jgi:long-chain acyl-CoA synthetase